MSDTVGLVRKVPMFAELDDDEMTWVADLATEFEVPAGFVLIERGQPGSGMFIITDGNRDGGAAAGARSSSARGSSSASCPCWPTGSRAMARVRATTPVKGLAISRMALSELLQREPRVAVRMLPVLARRLAEAESP